jgi:hypothetical protein
MAIVWSAAGNAAGSLTGVVSVSAANALADSNRAVVDSALKIFI